MIYIKIDKNMNYSTWEKSRWYVYGFGATINSYGRIVKDNDKVGILHLDLQFKIIDILEDMNVCINKIIKIEEIKSGIKVKYKEKIDLKRSLKKSGKDYINNRLRKGFENELFSIE
jgi:hypothetical protein